MAAWDQVQRISEPWYITKVAAIAGSFVFAMVLAYLAATGQFGMLILVAVWVVSCLTIIFVRGYWWAPALVITALSLETHAVGFSLTGLEVGMVIVALTFPVKLAMKTLRPMKPKLDPGMFYWVLISFVIAHAVVILFYSKIESAPQIKNIVKSYYGTIAPLVLYGMLVRYCDPKTVFRTCVVLFAVWFCTVVISIPVILLGIESAPLTNLDISVAFTDAASATLNLRFVGPLLFIAAIAFWPAARSTPYRVLLAFAVFFGIVATLLSGGRLSFFSCLLASIFFAVTRNRIWLVLPLIMVMAIIAGILTVKPDVQFVLPEGIQRAVAPLNFSGQETVVQSTLNGSDDWHNELRSESLIYWNQDTTSFWLGHGFKSWDDSIMNSAAGNEVDAHVWERFAVEMGRTENTFSSITNIFGLTGLLLYAGFLIQVAWRLWKARKASPESSVQRAVCEFSFVNLANFIFLAMVAGGVPDITVIYYVLGILAARPYIGIPEPATAAPAPAFDRSRELLAPASKSPMRGDPLTAFARRQSRFSMSGTPRSGS